MARMVRNEKRRVTYVYLPRWSSEGTRQKKFADNVHVSPPVWC